MYQRAADVENGRFVPAGCVTEAVSEAFPPSNASVPSGGKAELPQTSVSSAASGNHGAFSEINTLFSRLKLSSMDTGDLLLAAILYVTLHDTGDDDLFWIAAVLFLTGRGGDNRAAL